MEPARRRAVEVGETLEEELAREVREEERRGKSLE